MRKQRLGNSPSNCFGMAPRECMLANWSVYRVAFLPDDVRHARGEMVGRQICRVSPSD
jgi:hypothetical protein